MEEHAKRKRGKNAQRQRPPKQQSEALAFAIQVYALAVALPPLLAHRTRTNNMKLLLKMISGTCFDFGIHSRLSTPSLSLGVSISFRRPE